MLERISLPNYEHINAFEDANSSMQLIFLFTVSPFIMFTFSVMSTV